MSLTNILVVVDVDKIEPKPGKEHGTPSKPIKITNEIDCIFMYDDQEGDGYKGEGLSQLITKVSPGDLLVWSLLTKEKTDKKLTFARLKENTEVNNHPTPIFNWSSDVEYSDDKDDHRPISFPIISNKGKSCVANVSDNLKESTLYSYNIVFKLVLKGERTPYYYVLDPFIESRVDQ